VPRERATVVMVIDASQSMQATDVKPTRLDAAKQAAIEFVTKLPEKYNVSVVSMAGSCAILVPPTTAHHTVENAINSIQLQDSTAIGEGITTALRALQQAPKDPDNPNSIAPGAIVLLSDGSNTAGRAPQQAAAEAKAAKVPVYTIAYGTENGYVDLEGKREPVPVDHEEMKRIAAATNGEYFAAATADQLKKVYENIGSDVGYEKADREVTARFAGYGLALAVLAALGAISLGAKWP
jgi:Ca-activated chloride channel family protein